MARPDIPGREADRAATLELLIVHIADHESGAGVLAHETPAIPR